MAKRELPNLKKIRQVFETKNDNNSVLALSLLDKADFMEETLLKLQEKVKSDGVVTTMCQGSYEIERENPALKSYNTTIKNYTSVVKQIAELLPDTNKKTDGEDLLKFLAGGKK